MKKRILGAAIIVAIVLPILLKGGILFALLSLLLGLLAFKEIYDIKYKDSEKKIPFLLQILSYLCVAFLIMNNYEKMSKNCIKNSIFFNWKDIASTYIEM